MGKVMTMGGCRGGGGGGKGAAQHTTPASSRARQVLRTGLWEPAAARSAPASLLTARGTPAPPASWLLRGCPWCGSLAADHPKRCCAADPRVPLGWGGGGGATWAATAVCKASRARQLTEHCGWLSPIIRAFMRSYVIWLRSYSPPAALP